MQYYFLALVSLLFFSSNKNSADDIVFHNEDRTIKVNFILGAENNPQYQVYFNDKVVLDTSSLGVIRKDDDFSKSLEVIGVSGPEKVSDAYNMLQGKQKQITYEAQKYEVHLQNQNGKPMDIIFQISDDGVAFRYHFPGESKKTKEIIEELTTYNFIEDTKAWLQPMSRAKTGWQQTNPSYEENYLKEVSLHTESPIGEGWVYPALFKTGETWSLITEAGLDRRYAGTHLKKAENTDALEVTFPQKEEVFPGGGLHPQSLLPWHTPWRLITIGDLKTIVESTLGTDLATPAKEQNLEYIEPGLASWSWVLLKDEFTNYETSKKFIDYASEMDWEYCLIDADWDRRIGYERAEELVDYADQKDVKILLWYNSAGSWNTTPYTPKSKLLTAADRQKEFKKLNEMGVAGIKVDFFGGDGQSMIAYYHDIMKDAAEHELVLNFHGATLPRGWHRTYPNLLTVEAVKGYEFITFTQETADQAPAHSAMLPFTRNVFDPMDFTPMVLDSIPGITRKTTPAFELALPVLFLSGIQHIAEVPEGLAKQPDYVKTYLKDIPVNWDETRFISGYPGKDAVIARRKGETWHIVGINGEKAGKDLILDLSFLEGKKNGILITDGKDGFIRKNISTEGSAEIPVSMKEHGGFVMKLE